MFPPHDGTSAKEWQAEQKRRTEDEYERMEKRMSQKSTYWSPKRRPYHRLALGSPGDSVLCE